MVEIMCIKYVGIKLKQSFPAWHMWTDRALACDESARCSSSASEHRQSACETLPSSPAQDGLLVVKPAPAAVRNHRAFTSITGVHPPRMKRRGPQRNGENPGSIGQGDCNTHSSGSCAWGSFAMGQWQASVYGVGITPKRH